MYSHFAGEEAEAREMITFTQAHMTGNLAPKSVLSSTSSRNLQTGQNFTHQLPAGSWTGNSQVEPQISQSLPFSSSEGELWLIRATKGVRS